MLSDRGVTMARRKMIRVRVLRSFNGMRKGDQAEVVSSDRVATWIKGGFMEALDGQNPAGPGSAEPHADERVADGTQGGSPAGGEPGQSFGAGPYGSPA